MHHYDVAAKVLIQSCRDDIIRYFTGIKVSESTLIEKLPQETVSLKRSDFPVIRVYEMDGRQLIDQGPVCLLPFVPLMKHGKASLSQADDLIYGSEFSRAQKADMLTSMAILSGFLRFDILMSHRSNEALNRMT